MKRLIFGPEDGQNADLDELIFRWNFDLTMRGFRGRLPALLLDSKIPSSSASRNTSS
jgi:hypothetical protein